MAAQARVILNDLDAQLRQIHQKKCKKIKVMMSDRRLEMCEIVEARGKSHGSVFLFIFAKIIKYCEWDALINLDTVYYYN